MNILEMRLLDSRILGSILFGSMIAGLLVGSTGSTLGQETEFADVVIFNAKVMTPNSDGEEAIAIRGNRILAVGKKSVVQSKMGHRTIELDGRGGSITPGFNDAHVHFLSGSLSLGQVDLLDAQTLPEIESRIRSFSVANPKLPCVVGRGWVYGAFEGGLPNKEQLDRLISDRPAVMKCYDGHTVWVNSRALELAGIDRNTPDPPKGIIVRDADGNPTGALKEGAQSLVEKVIPIPTRSEKLNALRVGIREALRLGVTSIQEAGMSEEDLSLFEELRSNDELPIRAYFALEAHPGMTEEEVGRMKGIRNKYAKLNIGAVKMYADGVIEAHTAAVLEPYANNPSRGLPEYPQEEMLRIVKWLDRDGWQIMIHATGDGGIRAALDAFENAVRENPKPLRGRRHRVEHVESVSANDIDRFGRLGVIASMQPFHANPNGNIFQVWAVNLGPERASRAWAWKKIQDAGGSLAFGTDWPVVGIDPRPGIHTALTRQTSQGEPKEGFVPSQRLPLRSVLQAYTQGSAFAEFSEGTKGTIEVGKLADLVLWDRDLFAIPVHQVQQAQVVQTMVDGVFRWEMPR